MRDQQDNLAHAAACKVLPPDWVEAYRKYFRFWTNLARSASLTEDDAKDVVHTVITATLAQSGRRFDSIEHIRNYVAKGVLNRSIQARQRGDRTTRMTEHLELNLAAESQEQARDEETLRVVLREAIRRLPPKDFEILKLRFYSGLTFQEISQMLNRPVSTLKSREESAMKKVRAWFRKNGVSTV
jgi:RNA polymerase sigma factor (sigma-70 family)